MLAFLVASPSVVADGGTPAPAQVPKDRIPLYFLVLHFFESTAHFEDHKPYAYETRLAALGLEHGSDAGRALAQAARTAVTILAKPSVDPSLLESEEAFQAFQEAALADRARALAEVYGGLLAELEAAAVDPDRLPEYLDQVIRPKVSLWVEITGDQDPVAALFEDANVQVVLSFEEMAREYYHRNGGSSLPTKGE